MNEITAVRIPEKVRLILNRLHSAGFEAYAVGGCVRDSLLGRTPADWDITTSARPEETKRLFRKTIDTGIQHGTVTVREGGENFEVTTYRLDGKYEDHRHPGDVTFTASLREDLRRRDFTINAMAVNEEDGLVDLFGGREDLKAGVVRCVGEAEERFNEDALRILRAFRFAAQLGFEIDQDTLRAAQDRADTLSFVSAERIRTELEKLLLSPHPSYLREAWKAGVTKVILPEFDAEMEAPQNNAHHNTTVGEHTLRTLEASPQERLIRWTMLFHDMGKPSVSAIDENGIYHYRGHAAASAVIAKEICRRLKFDRATEERAVRLVEKHSIYPKLSDEGVRRSAAEIGLDLFPAFLKVKRSDILGQSPSVIPEKLVYMDGVEAIYRRILERGDCMDLKHLDISGSDLLAMGYRGKEIGTVLQSLLDEVLEDPARNEKNYLLTRAQELREKG